METIVELCHISMYNRGSSLKTLGRIGQVLLTISMIQLRVENAKTKYTQY